MTMALSYHPQGPREALARLALVAAALCSVVTFAARHARADNPRGTTCQDCVVVIGGCSGVCVSREGHILTAGHCKTQDVEEITWPDGRKVQAHKLYDNGKAEGCVVFDCDGEGYPFIPVSQTVPQLGDVVYSGGYPARNGVRAFEQSQGKVLGGAIRNEGSDEFLCNMTTDMGLAGGWSGGPLINARSEVIGVCNGFEWQESLTGQRVSPTVSRFVAWSTVREAYETAVTPSGEFTVYLRHDCAPCDRFKADCDSFDQRLLRGVFNGVPFRALMTTGSGPRFFCNGASSEGYRGRAELNAWLGQNVRRSRRNDPVSPSPLQPYTPPINPYVEDCPGGVCPADGPQRYVRAPKTPQMQAEEIKLVVCVNLGYSTGVEARKWAASITQSKLNDLCASQGLNASTYIVSRDLNPESYDRFAKSVGVDVKFAVVAFIPERDDASGLIRGRITTQIERIVKDKLDGKPLALVFERQDPKKFDEGVAALLLFSPDESDPQAPFTFTGTVLWGIMQDKSRLLDGIVNRLKWLAGKLIGKVQS